MLPSVRSLAHASRWGLGLTLCAMATAGHTAPAARFAHLSVEQGLSQNTVQAILQDHLGFLWFGTEEGLNRFDGYSFVVFKHDIHNPRSLPHDAVSALHEDRRRRLWVGTWGGLGVLDRRTEVFRVLTTIRQRVTAIAEGPDGRLWVGTDGQGLFESTPSADAFVQHRRRPEDPTSLASDAVSALLFDDTGRLWVGTRGAGLDRFEQGRFVHHRHDPADERTLSHDQISGLASGTGGELWIATYGGGVNVLSQASAVFRHLRHRAADAASLDTALLTCIVRGRGGRLWVGTDGAGVQRYDESSGRFVGLVHEPADTTSLSQNVVRTLYEDAQGQLWAGTYLAGANLLETSRQSFAYFTHNAADPSSLAHPVVTAFLEDRQSRIWVGTEGGWLHRFDRASGTFTRYRFPSREAAGAAILSLHQDRRDRIWVGTYGAGIGRFDPDHGRFVGYLGDEQVWDIAEDDDGALWLAARSLQRFVPERGVVTARYEPGGPEGRSTLRALRHDRHGNLWVGTERGLYVLRRDDRRLVGYRHAAADPTSLSDDAAVSLHEDGRGRLWVGTYGGGLNLLDPETQRFMSYRQFPSNAIYGIQEDARGRLWLSTNQGLSRFDTASGACENFDLTNGLQSLQFRFGASLRTHAGRLLFGSADGFYDFDPEALMTDTYAPRLVLTSLRIFNEPARLPAALSTLDELTLSHRDKVFSLEFAALDRTLPRRNQYAYRMEGLSDQWIRLGSKRDVTFTNLDPGRYVFSVRASNSEGVWNEAASTALAIVVRPPFWRTWWFRALGIVSLGLVLFAAHRARVGHLTADIAERKRATAALRQAEEKYRGIVENAVEGIFQSTREGRFLTVNPALARMLGYASPEEMVASVTDIEAQLCVDPARRREMIRLVEENGVVQGFELELRRRDGGSVWVCENVRLVRDEAGQVLYYEGTSEDVSDHRRARELKESLQRNQAMSSMGSLVAGVAHEVRNPLFSISANLEVLDKEIEARQPCTETLEIIHFEVSRLRQLMDELLEYGRPFRLETTPESLRDVVTEAASACSLLASKQGVCVANDVQRGLPLLDVDRRRLTQVFQNLIENAIQHSPHGSVIRASGREVWRDGHCWLECAIDDAGPGFESEDLARLFEPFFTRRPGGVGLGLSIVQRIVTAHGGSVHATNRGEGGARMLVQLAVNGVAPRGEAV